MTKKSSTVNKAINQKKTGKVQVRGVSNKIPRNKPTNDHLKNNPSVSGDKRGKKSGSTRIQQLEQELVQRKDELTILNSVGEAMAKTLDVKTVTKIVGDKIQNIFAAEGVTIRLYDRT